MKKEITNEIDTIDIEELKILCPFCNKSYTAEMIEKFDYSMASCQSGGTYESEMDYEIEIKCDNCKKIVYRKKGFKDFLDYKQ